MSAAATDPRAAFDETPAREQTLALRCLLSSPLWTRRRGAEELRVIVRRRDWLTDWFSRHFGWTLIVDAAAGFARLHKVSASAAGCRAPGDDRRTARFRHARAAALPGKPPFDRRRYALFCLCLAALEDCAGQVTLRRLAEILQAEASAAPSVETFDPSRLPERRAFVDAIRLLLELGVLSVRDGETERFLSSEDGDALYDVNEPLLGQLLAAPVPPSLAGSFDAMLEETYAETDDGERQRARHQVMRRLIDDPIVYWEDLSPRQRDWLERSLGHVARVMEEAGMVLERRREGLSAIDPGAELTDVKFPDGGSTVKHAALLLAEQLTRRARDEGSCHVSRLELEKIMSDLSADYGERCGWRAEYQEEEGAHRLGRDAMELLASLDLARREGDGWLALPAIARFAPASPEEAAAASRSRRGR